MRSPLSQIFQDDELAGATTAFDQLCCAFMPRVGYASPVGLGGIQKQKTWNKLETERDCILRMVRLGQNN